LKALKALIMTRGGKPVPSDLIEAASRLDKHDIRRAIPRVRIRLPGKALHARRGGGSQSDHPERAIACPKCCAR
jgi:hypothetical protein